MTGAKQQNTKRVFFSGVLLLTLSTVLVKIIGFLYKLPMLSFLGSEGMGYFHSAYEIYALFCVIATAGLPVALSVLVSGALAEGNREKAEAVYRTARSVFLFIGAAGCAVMILFAGTFCELIHSRNAYGCILSISPTVFFVCVSSAVRGYFQGHQKMLPTAVSQLIEAMGKVVFGLLFAYLVLLRGGDTASVAAAAGWGLTCGTALSALWLLAKKRRFSAGKGTMGKRTTAPRPIRKELFRLALPMTVGASLVSLTKLVDMAMILRRLQSVGYTEALANEAYGSYTTLALSVFALLPTLVNSVSMPLLPLLSAAIASKDAGKQRQMIAVSYRLTAFFAVPASLGLSAFAHPLLSLLFAGEPEAVDVAAPLLSALGASVFLSCMIGATNAVLHAYRTVGKPILSMLAGGAVKVIFAYFLIGNPKIALLGAPVSTFLCNAVILLLNLSFAEKKCAGIPLGKIFLPPLLSSVFAVGAAFALYLPLERHFGGSALLTAAILLFCVVLYLLFSCFSGVLKREDLAALPGGERLCAVLTALRLLAPVQ